MSFAYSLDPMLANVIEDDTTTKDSKDAISIRPSFPAESGLSIKNNIPERPLEVTVYDGELTSSPIPEYNEIDAESLYPLDRDEHGSVVEPVKPSDFSDPYLFPMLSRNEYLRLRYLWYYGQHIEKDKYLLSCLQDQVDLVNEIMGKDCVILGLLDHDYYKRIVTANLPLATLPRREATCSHTILQKPGSVFMVGDMERDWRFATSPHVEDGLRFYAGTQLRYKIPALNTEIAFGSICIANFTPTEPLSKRQQTALVKFSDIIVHTIIERANNMRMNEREQMTKTLVELWKHVDADTVVQEVLRILKARYPFARSSCQRQPYGYIDMWKRGPIPYKSFVDSTWEDTDELNRKIKSSNHRPYLVGELDPSIRAIAIQMKFDEGLYLVVETSDMKKIFDDTDLWFVSSLALLACTTLQTALMKKIVEAKSRFLKGFSHELRTPIHAILTSCELLVEGSQSGDISPSQRNSVLAHTQTTFSDSALAMLGNIDTAGHDLLSSINNLLDYDQFENRDTVKVMQLTSLNSIEEEVLREAVSTFIVNKHVEIISDNRLPPDVEMIATDFNLLKQCLGQLVRNAVKFTTKGQVIIQTCLSEDYRILEYNIVDSGIGIDECHFNRIFLPFQKLDQGVKGIGLGLTVARRIAEVLGGSLCLVSSSENQGSHFQLRLINPVLACPINGYMKRNLLSASMPLTYFIPADRPKDSVHLTCASGNLQRMGFSLQDRETAKIAVVESSLLAAVSSDYLDNFSRDQIVIYICHNYAELKESEITLRNKACAQRLIRCLAPVRRGRLWQAVETAIVTNTALKTLSLEERKPPKIWSPDLINEEVKWVDNPTCLIPVEGTSTSIVRSLDTLNILIVDDNPTNLGILKMYCRKRKFRYLTAVNGKEANEKYASSLGTGFDVSLVLMDLEMPVKNGIDSTRDIRKLEAEREIQPCMVFMVTGQNGDEDKKRSVAAGANGYYVKPLSMRTLDELILLHFPKAQGKIANDKLTYDVAVVS